MGQPGHFSLTRMAIGFLLLVWPSVQAAEQLDLSQAVVVVAPDPRPAAEQMAATILVEEVAKRTGIRWTVQQFWPRTKQPVIAISRQNQLPPRHRQIPQTIQQSPTAPSTPEAFSLHVTSCQPACVVIEGADARGVMYGAGRLLRELCLNHDTATVDADLQVAAGSVRFRKSTYRQNSRPTALCV